MKCIVKACVVRETLLSSTKGDHSAFLFTLSLWFVFAHHPVFDPELHSARAHGRGQTEGSKVEGQSK